MRGGALEDRLAQRQHAGADRGQRGAGAQPVHRRVEIVAAARDVDASADVGADQLHQPGLVVEVGFLACRIEDEAAGALALKLQDRAG